MHNELLLKKIRKYIALSEKECALIKELFKPLSLTRGNTIVRR